MHHVTFQGVNTRCYTSLRVAGHLNFEAQESYYVNIRAVDANGLFVVRRFKVEVIDVNDVPIVRHKSNIVGIV